MELNLLQFDEDIQNKLIKANLISCNQILSLTKTELQKIGNFCPNDVDNIFYFASKSVKLNVLPDSQTITTGCKKIDALLGGGFHCHGINELSGESGCGKTQLCLQLALTAQNSVSLGGVNKSVLYICTEDRFPSKRLLQLINNIQPPFKSCNEISYGDRIYIEHIPDVSSFKDCLFSRLPKLLNTGEIGLIIVDSIAAIFRSEYTPQEGLQRTKDLRVVGCQLHLFSKKYNLCVVCVNQVTASLSTPEKNLIPALGLAWANLVTSRVLMKKYHHHNYKEIELIFSPHCGPNICKYTITETGIRGI